MRRLTIGGKEYTIEFSIEASLYNECTEAAMNLVMGFGEAQGAVEMAKGDDEAEKVRSAIRKTFSSIANIPATAMTLFYAGLLEHHGNEIQSIDDAKDLIRVYLKDNDLTFVDVLNLMLECMGEDHFFDLTGLSKVLNTEEKKPKRKKTGGD